MEGLALLGGLSAPPQSSTLHGRRHATARPSVQGGCPRLPPRCWLRTRTPSPRLRAGPRRTLHPPPPRALSGDGVGAPGGGLYDGGGGNGSGSGGGSGGGGGGSSGREPGGGGGGGDDGGDDGGPLAALAELRGTLQPLGLAFKQAVQAVWAAQRVWLQHSLARASLALALLAGAATAAANWWGVRAVNAKLLPGAQEAVAHALQRELSLGAVRWLAPTGILGLGPLACLGPVAVGPRPVEGSSATVERVWVGLDALQSLRQRRLVLAVKGHGAQVELVQADNFSWFGYPEDTVPSARNFVPGLGGGGDDEGPPKPGGSDGTTGGGSASSAGGSSNSSDTSNGSSALSERRRSSSSAAGNGIASAGSSSGTSHRPQRHLQEGVGGAVASASSPLQALVERLTQELMQAASRASKPAEQQQQQGEQQMEQQRQQAASEVGAEQRFEVQQQPEQQGQEKDGRPTLVLLGVGGAASSSHPSLHPGSQQQQQPAGAFGVALAPPGPGSSSSVSRSSGAGSQPASQPQPAVEHGQAQAAEERSSSTSGFFGSRLGWGRSVGRPKEEPAAGAPAGAGSRRQQQLATLNAMRLQAGRGFSLLGGPQAAGAAEDSAATAAASQESGGSSVAAEAPVSAAVSAVDAATSAATTAAPSSTSLGPQEAELEPAGQRSTTLPRTSEQQQQAEEAGPPPRMLRRRWGALGSQARPRPLGPLERTSPSPSPATGTGHAAIVPAAAGSTPLAPKSAGRSAVAGQSGHTPLGSAASLNRMLRPLAARKSGRLYSASAASPSRQRTLGQKPEREAAASAAAAEGSRSPQAPAPAAAAAAAASTAAQAAVAAEPSADAAARPPASALPSMTPEQRRSAVAAVNSLPAIVADMPFQRRRAEMASGARPDASSARLEAPEQAEAAAQQDSPAARRINALGAVHAPDSLQPHARVSAAARGSFAPLVVDPATQHKKGGSASLPWAHQRPPATTLIGSRLSGSKQSSGEETDAGNGAAAVAGSAAADVEHAAEGAAVAASGEGTFQLDSALAGSPAAAGSSDAGAAGGGTESASHAGPRRPPLLHPGYFTPASGPTYTPAPPEAIIDARARRATLGSLLSGLMQAALQRLVLPEVALGTIRLTGASLDAHISGEALPRRFADIAVDVSLGPRYDTLDVRLTASPHERHPASAKCTMPSPHAHRHLRHVTGASAARDYRENLEAAAAGDAAAAAAAAAAEQGCDLPAAAMEGQSIDPAEAYAGKPTGGQLEVRVIATGITSGQIPSADEEAPPGVRAPTLDIRIRGSNLHAPMVERTIELPLDITAGRATGELRLYCHDGASWLFPEFYGRVSVRDGEFHFWDATDDVSRAHLDLLFERDRVYLHNAAGRFGAVPMTLTGELDLNPEGGQYRLSAAIPGVEVNALRATLGVRPTPQPVAGAVAGVLHVTGPLEKPVFSGTARAVRPCAEQLAGCEPSEALAALACEPRAVGVYDRVPVAAAGAVFALDTGSETMQLHSMNAELLDGGELRGSGRMWVAPRAEMDPSAVSITAEGRDLAVEAVARRYLPEGLKPPPGMVLGRASLAATMQGSHLAPTLSVSVQLPEAAAAGSATLCREFAKLSLSSREAAAAVTAHLCPPSFEAVKAAITQQVATALSKPRVSGLDGDVTLKGLDVVPWVSDEAALRQLAVQQSGQPLRLKLNGRVRVSGTVQQRPGAPAAEAGSAGSGSTIGAPGWEFAGDLGLEGMCVNQLKLWQKLAGRLAVSGGGVSVHGKGVRANETLDLDLALPLLAPPAPQQQVAREAAAAAEASADGAEAALAEQIVAGEAAQQQQQAQPRRGGGRLQLRCGLLQVAADVNAPGSQVNFKVAALKLDELELASLRGDLQEISCSLNFDSHTGRGKVSLASPRYSGLRGDSLSGAFRWERDVVRLEKLVLVQQRSRYEVGGEYSLPPNTPLPSSAADLAAGPAGGAGAGAGGVPPGGRWRVQVSVPTAELQEIIPAARLLQSATSLSPPEYERAKARFLQAIERASIRAAELNSQLRAMAEQLAPGARPSDAGGNGGAARRTAPRPPNGGGGGSGSALHLPGLQDVRGQWSGTVQAFGGGSSATSCEFDMRGQGWQWGSSYGLDALAALGTYHSEEGLHLQEFVLKSGDAKLHVRGSLLGEHQDASVMLTDFPMATLRPIFRAMPALQHAAPAVPAQSPPPVAAPRPLGMLTNTLGRVATKGLRGEGPDADSPINGLLFMNGKIMGSQAQPKGEVVVQLYDSAVGETRLQEAHATARLEQQQLSFSVDVVPAEGHRQSGYVKASGVVPLLPEAAGAGAGSSDGAAAQAQGQPAAAAASSQQAAQAQQQQQQQQQLDVRLSVKDGGMALLTSVTPDLRWQSGQAAVDVRLRGSLERPVLSGTASISKATLECPSLLRWPLTNVAAEVRAGGGMLTVESLEARSGRRGSLRLRGSLPVYAPAGAQQRRQQQGGGQGAHQQQRLVAEASGLELRLRNMYSGLFDAGLVVAGSLASPTVGGSMRFSKGMVLIVPQGAPDVASAAPGGSSDALLTPGGAGQAGSVARVFDILTRGESGLAQQFETVMKQEVEAVEAMVEDAGQHNVSLDGLAICLGPDLRAMYPLVMNFGVAGQLALSGPAHPDQVRVRGTVRLPSGDVNLVATQLALDREHANLITFHPDQSPGLDPLVDLVMTGGDLRVAIQGKASEWQDHLSLHYISSKARPDSGEALDPADAARLFEDKLKQQLLAEDGQLALSRLAGTTVSTLMPKIETQGQVGGTRWRLVSAPSIPGLLSLDPSLADPSNILSNITMGTEVEVQFGRKLQAAMTRKLQESDVTTQWSLTYKLNSKLRMQFNITSAPPFPKTLMFQFSSEGAGST